MSLSIENLKCNSRTSQIPHWSHVELCDVTPTLTAMHGSARMIPTPPKKVSLDPQMIFVWLRASGREGATCKKPWSHPVTCMCNTAALFSRPARLLLLSSALDLSGFIKWLNYSWVTYSLSVWTLFWVLWNFSVEGRTCTTTRSRCDAEMLFHW